MPISLLQTKFYAPPTRPNLVHRAQLLARFSAESVRPFTLVSAPAGFGKTTLICTWLEELRTTRYALRNDTADAVVSENPKSPTPNPAVAWLSLDEDDNDPPRFLTYLIAALQTHHLHLGENSLALLAAPQTPSPKSILTQVINDVSTLAEPLILILDDYHLITSQSIHEALTFLLDHLPTNLRLVITSRVDPPLPLSRWRVRQQLLEIRADDLRFSAAEATIFLNEIMGLQLKAEEIATLDSRTEGWIAGLQLAALSMQGQNSLDAFITNFSGSNHYIVDYLFEEVLTRLPKAVEYFLITTSILERFCAPLCEALTDQGEAQQTLHFLEKSNLFLISLDNRRQWYRYHHLFAEVLHNRLQQWQPLLISDLHCRASDWYQNNELFVQAIHHALAAHSLERVSAIIETQGLRLLLRGEAALVNGWLRYVPETMLQARPRLALTACWNWMTAREINQVAQLLSATTLDVERLPVELQGERVLLDAHLAFFQEDFATALAGARAGLALVTDDNPALQSAGSFIMAVALLRTGEIAQAQTHLQRAMHLAQVAKNGFHFASSAYVLHQLQRAAGADVQAQATLEEALRLITQPGERPIPAVGMLYLGLGELLCLRGDENQGEELLQRGVELTKACFELFALVRGWSTQARLRARRNDRSAALTILDEGIAWLEEQDRLLAVMREQAVQALLACKTELLQTNGIVQNPPSKIQNLIEPLSERELEILQLVNAGLSNSEIAATIIVTVGTVKKHLNNIFGKLGVTSRTQAMVRAREVKLLE